MKARIIKFGFLILLLFAIACLVAFRAWYWTHDERDSLRQLPQKIGFESAARPCFDNVDTAICRAVEIIAKRIEQHTITIQGWETYIRGEHKSRFSSLKPGDGYCVIIEPGQGVRITLSERSREITVHEGEAHVELLYIVTSVEEPLSLIGMAMTRVYNRIASKRLEWKEFSAKESDWLPRQGASFSSEYLSRVFHQPPTLKAGTWFRISITPEGRIDGYSVSERDGGQAVSVNDEHAKFVWSDCWDLCRRASAHSYFPVVHDNEISDVWDERSSCFSACIEKRERKDISFQKCVDSIHAQSKESHRSCILQAHGITSRRNGAPITACVKRPLVSCKSGNRSFQDCRPYRCCDAQGNDKRIEIERQLCVVEKDISIRKLCDDKIMPMRTERLCEVTHCGSENIAVEKESVWLKCTIVYDAMFFAVDSNDNVRLIKHSCRAK